MDTTKVHDIATIDVHALAALRARREDIALIDVRTAGEFETAHIPGSSHLPLDQLDGACAALAETSTMLVLVCRSGNRAHEAARRLVAAGASNPSVLEGGLLAWEASGGDVRRGQQRWELERQVRLVAGTLVLTSVVASAMFEPAKWLAAAVGAGLTFSALTNTCALASLLGRLPYNRGSTCTPRPVTVGSLPTTPTTES